MIDVSIVIVCMNNLKNLYPCLDSIRKYTTKVTYETFVVAYLFSKENLADLREKYPWVTVVGSNEIRGFSENNNLALRQARGKYCFVQNDDTEYFEPVVDELFETFEKQPNNVAAVSPKGVFGDGSFQSCGRPIHSFKTYLLSTFHLWSEAKINRKLKYATGVFETGDLCGAYFMIRADAFRKIGWFDERYFFCPEDIAVMHELRKLGYKAMVDADVQITHYEGMSGKSLSMTKTATAPAASKGSVIFYSDGYFWKNIVCTLLSALGNLASLIFHTLKCYGTNKEAYRILQLSNINSIKAVFSSKTPKEIFCYYYQRLQ